MTQEEKAKAYDEALTIAKRIISKNCSEVEKLCLKSIFPELAESEDERIGNVIYCIVRDNKEVKRILEGNGVLVDNALAYLEKQKEQKPAEWSEEDEDAINGAIGILLDDNNPNFVFPEHSKLSVGEIVKRLKYLPERFVLQPKPEWGEEDEDMLWNIISIVGQSKSIQADEMLDWLKSLRPSWKPSEEQMEALAYAIQVLNSNPHPRSAKAYQDLQTLYKNIKYGN